MMIIIVMESVMSRILVARSLEEAKRIARIHLPQPLPPPLRPLAILAPQYRSEPQHKAYLPIPRIKPNPVIPNVPIADDDDDDDTAKL